jgi:hypothetical protein
MYRKLLNVIRFNKIFWWVVGILLLANIVFFVIVRVTQNNRISALQKQYDLKRNLLTQKKENEQGRFLKAKDDISFFKENLPVKNDFAEVASELFSILSKHQLNVGQVVYKPESIDVEGLFKYSTLLDIKGNYSLIKSVLADIQESKTLFCIEELSISSVSAEDLIEMKIKIATYFR